ncbi:glycosyltransferase [Mucilaginibacter sabulilitoris]|uniref:Glycosyltransferase n=1 Tax=Mucilaginibacter sabulilitoris TaxID=1173583 RepID=A0ABZ0TST5_9SPHI|nr:glycosyltransferase [Mucilaginibacter sabulilitoris]WPU95527.1 glycosyltransferase [Mucilaginibacter sabulilitoris]
MMNSKIPKTAIVHDLLLAMGGAENTLESIYRIHPSPIFTLVLNRNGIKDSLLSKATIITSFIQRFPRVLKAYRTYLPFYPLAIEQFDLRQYDIILSSSFIVAKGVITNTEQLHICYLHNPIRPAWELYQQFLSQSNNGTGLKGLLTRLVFHYLRQWDVLSATRVDHFIANSNYTARRIKKIYNRDADVIYPPVNVDLFELEECKEAYYVTASRLVYHKRIDLIVKAFAQNPDRKLIVLGDGPELKKLKLIATPNVELMGFQPKHVLISCLQKAKAFVFAAQEDFGIAPIEAMACGTPVLAFGKGGTLETVIPGETGLFFYKQTVESICNCIADFESGSHMFSSTAIREHAAKFSVKRFEQEFTELTRQKINEFYEKQIAENRRQHQDYTLL